ncbi:MAG: M48 family metallopeptidase [Alphaproteobacteria bacterium]|nr:M48 family metallopeptidase [Alphaproteobacteria bacterium]QQS57620.1 MAG: M48 family metallopeptidase [Alphaproteobacteria bacterium]
MAATVGLKSHIWNNNLRSVILLVLYPVLLMIMVWAISLVIGVSMEGQHQYNTQPDPTAFANAILMEYWPTILTVVLIWFAISWFFHTSMIRKLSHSHPVSRTDEPELYNLLENLCISRGMKMPRLEIIETHARNAFASGIDEKSYSITVTRGLMNSLTRDEMEGVLGHELTHIINRDVRLLIITVIFTGMFGFAAQLVWSSIRYRVFYTHGRRDNNGGIVVVVFMIAIILWLGYLATLLMRFALSRHREYMADAGAIELTRNPEAMMRALMRIAGRDRIPQTTDDIAMMCIENHVPFLGLFATHPPIEARIRAISETTGTPVPELPHTGPAPKEEAFAALKEQGERPNPWLTRGRRI